MMDSGFTLLITPRTVGNFVWGFVGFWIDLGGAVFWVWAIKTLARAIREYREGEDGRA